MLLLREEGLEARHGMREVVVDHHPTLLGVERAVVILLVGRWKEKVLLKRKFNMIIHDCCNWSYNLGRMYDFLDRNLLRPER